MFPDRFLPNDVREHEQRRAIATVRAEGDAYAIVRCAEADLLFHIGDMVPERRMAMPRLRAPGLAG